MVESRTAMLARLKSMRRRYGLGEFKKNKVVRRVRTGVQSMARKRKSFSRSSSGGMMKNVSAGIGAAVLVQKFGGPSLGNLGGIASLGAAYYVGGMPGALGALVVNGNMIGNMLGGSSSQAASW